MGSNGKLDGRWTGIERPYTREEVERLRGTVHVEHTLARLGAERLWELLHTEDYVPTLGALSGGQAVQMVRAGLKAIYLSGWQVAADANLAGHTYPDQSLYPANSVPAVVRRINAARLAADVCGVQSIVIARTDALAADLLTTDVDERDKPFLTGERTAEGFFRVKSG